MNCKYCGAELEDGQTVCPACGADNAAGPRDFEDFPAGPETDEPLTEPSSLPEDVVPPEAESEAPAEAPADDGSADEDAGETPKRPKKAGKGLLIGLAAVALVAVAAIIFVIARDSKKTAPAASAASETTASASASAGETTAKETTAEDKALEITQYIDKDGKFVDHDFQVADADVTEETANQVVATCSGKELTNATLSYYYWQQYYNLLSSYGSYISYFLDTTKSLASQMYDETHSWQDMLLQSSMASFRQNAAACAAAETAGFKLDEKYTSYLDGMASDLETNATSSGYKSAEDYLKSFYGPYASVDSYVEFARTSMTAAAYLQTQYDALKYTEDDVSKYYDDHAADYQKQNIEKNDTKMVNVRHILIKPVADANAETDANGQTTYTDKNWSDAEAKAKEIYSAWKAGDATEDSFASMAKESSEDTGSASNGGLYENVYPGEMETAFNDWCFADGRKAGDTDIIKTSYGYHVMYFSGFSDKTYWYSKAESDYVKSLQTALTDKLIAASDFTVDYSKVALMESDLTKQDAGQTGGTSPESQAESETASAAETTASSAN